ncbi:MAG TPA: tripartite tricarboxylate transporter substrate-binding protein, partial [Gammaproteobacteria bacterium]|nr:tripartite tricarboxylate transporter substrate-binding protein [Gammaproteobacteria bacterium]
IDVITHASPGGGTDLTARSMIAGARASLGVDMAVVFKGGGGGVVAMNYVDDRQRDGYTVMAITPTHLFALARGQSAISIDDLVGVARATEDPLIVTTGAVEEIRTLADLVALGHERPIKWGTGLVGGIDHVAGLALAKAAATPLSAVPFAGGGEVAANLIGRNIDAAALNLSEALDEIERGSLRGLAVMARQRLELVPEIPTTVELGYDAVFATVRGYVVLRGTPEDRIAALEHGLLAGMQHAAYREYLAGAGLSPAGVAGRGVWDAQIRELYAQAHAAMLELGML